MMPAVRCSALSLLTAAVLLPAPLAAAETYRNEEEHFTVDFPRGWVRMSADELNDLKEAARETFPGQAPRIVAGFRPKSVEPGEYPLVIVAVGPGVPGRPSFDEIEQNLKKTIPAVIEKRQKALGGSAKMTTEPPVFDRARARVILQGRLDEEDVGYVRRVVSLHFGADRTVVVGCYAMEDNFERRKTAFEMVTDSVKFDPGHEFREGTGSSFERGKAAGGAFGGLIIGGLIIKIVMDACRPRRRPRRYDDRRAQYDYGDRR